MGFKKVRFFYSSKVSPSNQFACDCSNAVNLLDALKTKGIEVEIEDVAGKDEDDTFMDYHRAANGPTASLRSVFGTKGALASDFGRGAPALLFYKNAEDSYPEEVFPRMDKETSKMVGIEKALSSELNVRSYTKVDTEDLET